MNWFQMTLFLLGVVFVGAAAAVGAVEWLYRWIERRDDEE